MTVAVCVCPAAVSKTEGAFLDAAGLPVLYESVETRFL